MSCSAIIYQGIITPDVGTPGRYIGLCEPVFKGRSWDHKISMTYQKYESKTDLAKFYWQHKKRGVESKVKFSILERRFPYRAGSKKCDLCLSEKLLIMKEEYNIINERDELVSKCRHANKFLLKNFKSKKK